MRQSNPKQAMQKFLQQSSASSIKLLNQNLIAKGL